MNEIAFTYDCKAWGCTNSARSQRGPWSYCDDHRGIKGIVKKPRQREQYRELLEPGSSCAEKLHHLRNLARNADRATAKARKLTVGALEAKRDANEKTQAFFKACREVGFE